MLSKPMSFHQKTCSKWTNVIFCSSLTVPDDLARPVQFQRFSIATSTIRNCSGLSMVFRLQNTQRPQSFPGYRSEGTPVYHVWIYWYIAFTTRVSNRATNRITSNHFFTFHLLLLRHDPFMHFGCSMQRRIVVQSTILSDQHNTWAHRRSCMRFQLLPAGFMTLHFLKMADTTKFEIRGGSCSSTASVGALFTRFGVPRCIPQALGTPQRGAGHGAGCAGWERS